MLMDCIEIMSQENLIHVPYVDMMDLSVDFEWTKEALENQIKYSDYVDTNFEAAPIYEHAVYYFWRAVARH